MRLFTISAAVLLGSALSAADAQQLGSSRPVPDKFPSLQKGQSGPGGTFVSGGSDSCATATAIAGAGPFLGDNLGAGTDGPAACGAIGADVWYDWTAAASGSTVAALCGAGTNYDTVLQVFDTAACTGTSLGCNDDFCAGLRSQVTFTAVAGNVYKIRIGGFGSSTGSYQLDISAPSGPPANDDCATPTNIGNAYGTFPFNNSAATTGAQGQGEGACLFFGSTAIDRDVWFTWTAPTTASVALNLCGQTTIDSKVAVYDGAGCPSAATIACNDDSCGLQSALNFNAVAGNSYTIQLGVFVATAGGTGTFTLSGPPPPAGPCDVFDDGVSSNSLGFGAASGTEVLWMHKQGGVGVSTVVKSISTCYGTLLFPGSSPPNGTPARVGIWDDPNDDGNPNDLVLIQAVNTTVQNGDTDIFNVVNLSPSVLVSGVYFIGAATSGPFPAPMDESSASGGRAWIAGDNAGTVDFNNLNGEPLPPADMDSIGFPSVFMLRGDCKDIEITEICGVVNAGDCPCGNDGSVGNGCANSANPAGAHLAGSGNAIVSADTVSIVASGVRKGNPTLGLFFSGNEQAPAPVNDGLLCAGSSICRLWTWSIPGPGGGTITLTGPDASTIPPNVGIAQRSADLGRAISNGETRVYTVWYRDPANFACPSPAVSNYTNALRILWSL